MWFGGHVRRELSAYCHGELPPGREHSVRAHLEACARCRAAHEEIRFGVALAAQIRTSPAPASLWSHVRERLEAPVPDAGKAAPAAAGVPTVAREVAHGRRLWRAALATTAALAALVVALGLLRRAPSRVVEGPEQARNGPLELVTAPAAPTAFEVAARDAHLERLAGSLAYDYVTASPETLRPWLREHAGFDLSLAVVRPPGDAGRFQLLGAKVIRAAGARAALVGYEVDAHPVTLVSAPLRDVPDPPEELHLRKKVMVRFDAARGLKLLTWGADGQAYVLVSDLPAAGTDACGICHTTPERRALIRDAPIRSGA
ncbi:MAG TPA: anti-sigma factor [Candidatus Polarisedimenticolia bacterium]|nr:anti-sigma factor [Candidatus Polarisedimenticolia bacterium]